MADALKPGDTVKLKSGSSLMTVSELYPNGKVNCSWFLDGDVKTAVFIKETLKLQTATPD
ncbi:YodC family protein [Solimicrobium silvestre]|uniref:Putative small protein n=1 Tax=Solimicrobium silvestre TaxID=2099400 RepID=A0A2S9GY70_9BURK|nr:DUF2158 domain-containing protein [Solimicrobium silvestre]PRC92661.1 putative small protein [Solimicrobium silvestre]